MGKLFLLGDRKPASDFLFVVVKKIYYANEETNYKHFFFDASVYTIQKYMVGLEVGFGECGVSKQREALQGERYHAKCGPLQVYVYHIFFIVVFELKSRHPRCVGVLKILLCYHS